MADNKEVTAKVTTFPCVSFCWALPNPRVLLSPESNGGENCGGGAIIEGHKIKRPRGSHGA